MEKNKSFTKLMIGKTVANIGNTIYTIAIISSIFDLTKSALASSLVPVIINGAMVVSGLIIPLIIRYFSLTNILKYSQFFKTFLLFVLAIYFQLNVIKLNVYILYVIIAGISFLDGFSYPVGTALIPFYVKKSDLLYANSIFDSVNQMVNIGSWAIGSTLLLIFSVTNLIWLDVIAFIVSTFILWYLPNIEKKKKTNQNSWKSFLSGWSEIKNNKMIRVVVSMDILENIANTAWVSSIVLVFVKEVLNVTEIWWGYINATFFVGTLIGSIIVIRATDWVNKNKGISIFYGSLFGAVVTLLVTTGWKPLFILICSVFVGIFSQIKNIPQATAIQQKISHEKLASFYAATNVLYMGTFSVALVIMGYISDHVGVSFVFLISSLLLFVVAAIAKIYSNLFD